MEIFIPDNTSPKGAGLTGLTSASTNLVIAWKRQLDAAFTTYTGASIEAITDIGTFVNPSANTKIRFKAAGATSAPGLYQLMFHDTSAAFGAADTSQAIIINIYESTTTALNIGPNMVQIPLVAYDPTLAVQPVNLTQCAGGTVPAGAIPNAAAGAANGLPTVAAGGVKLQQTVDLTAGQLVFKKNVARPNFAFPMYDTTGALKTGLTVTAAIRKDAGAAFVALAGAVTEIGTTGWYTVDFAQAETNADTIAFSASAATANPTCLTILTQA